MDLSLTRPDLVLLHVHMLVTYMDKLLDLRESMLMRGEHKCRVSEVGRVMVPVDVGNEFLS